MECKTKEDFVTRSGIVIFGDSNHYDNEIVDFFIDYIKQNSPENIYLELPKEEEHNYINGSSEQRERILNDWSSRPEKFFHLIEAAESVGARIVFFDDQKNLEEVRAAYNNFISSDDKTEESAKALVDLRMSVNPDISKIISEHHNHELSIAIVGLSHVVGSNDIDEMIDREIVKTVGIFHRKEDKASAYEMAEAMLGEIEPTDTCVFLNPPGKNDNRITSSLLGQ